MPEIKDILAQLDGENRLRTIPQEATGMIADLSSNDYTGLGELATDSVRNFSTSLPRCRIPTSSASRLPSQRQKYHFALGGYTEGLTVNLHSCSTPDIMPTWVATVRSRYPARSS